MVDVERRISLPTGEIRAESTGSASRLVGYAAVFGDTADFGDFRERVVPGAFRKTLASGSTVKALWNHDTGIVLGSTASGTLSLEEDTHGLKVAITPPDTQQARDLLESVKRGDVSQMSFGFGIVKDRWTSEGGKQIRELLEVRLYEVSPVAFPAYTGTEVVARHRGAANAQGMANLFHARLRLLSLQARRLNLNL